MSQIDPHRLIEPQAYADFGYPHEEFATLRREEPVAFFEAEGWSPFWAVTKHENIVEISKQPDKFSNQSGATFMPDRGQGQDDIRAQLRTIIDMDPPDHRDYRKIVSASFSPRAIARLTPVVERVAKELVDGLGREGEADLIPDFASIHPLKVVCHLLGVPEEDEPKVLRLTNELFGNADPEFQRSGEVNDNMKALFAEFWAYFGGLLTDRRTNPREDLVSVFANAKVRGEPMGELETLGYCLIAFTAGHETTRGAISGGLQILSERPDLRKQWAKNLDKSRLAIDEIIRYVTPVTHMMRTALTDYQLGDKQIKAGDTLVLFYASANRDEDVFEAPDEIRLDRYPNPHVAFGVGEHFCIGSHLARLTSGSLFRELVSRLELLEPAGKPERTASNLVPGFKHLPLRYRLAPSASA
ncbi:MAG: cytochrome P450 [Deltaproteobacteria bacterium]|nr:cytochrome P450 [Deltaproteobacteria bacterium]